MYRYAQVEAALATLYHVPESYKPGFSARLKYFRRIGLVKTKPGKGARVEYGFGDVALLAMCLELSQFGMDPTRIAAVSQWIWPLIESTLCEDHEGEKVFAATPVLAVREMVERGTGGGKSADGFFSINITEQKPRFVFDVEELANWRPGRAIQVNLTELRDRLVNVLAGSQEAKPEEHA